MTNMMPALYFHCIFFHTDKTKHFMNIKNKRKKKVQFETNTKCAFHVIPPIDYNVSACLVINDAFLN